MKQDECHTEGLEVGGWWYRRKGVRREGVDLRTEEVDERMNEDRAEVFDEEDGAPGDLWT